MRTKNGFIVLALVCFFLSGTVFCVGGRSEDGPQVILEEVGQFNDGGMAVTVLVVDTTAYVCEFDNGLEILDIRDPGRIKKVSQIESTEQSRGIEVIGHTAYVSCNVNGLKLYDIGDPSRPVFLGEYADRDGDPHQLLAAGDIGYLTEWHGGFDIIDLTHPGKPVRLSQYRAPGMMAFSAALASPYAFVTGYKAGLKILDISDPKEPVLVGEFNNGGETNAVQVRGGRAYVCDKLQGLEILDVSDPAHPRLLGTYNGGGSTVGVSLVDNLAFLINWDLGLEVVDVSDPSRPVKVGSFHDGGRPNGLQVVGDLIYMADGSDGLEILRFRKEAGLARRESKDFPKLTGPYLGQTPPGERIAVFAPGIVTVEENFEHSAAVFSPDGQEVFWCTNVGAYTDHRIEGNLRLYTMKCIDGQWTAPRRAPFAEDTYVERPVFSPDGSRLYFERARLQDKDSDFDIFVVERTDGGWSDPVPVSPLINSPAMERLHCVAADGSLYFSRDPFTPREVIYVSRWRNGTFTEPETMEDIDIAKGAVLAFVIAPDQSFMLIDRMNDRYTSDLLVRFKKSDGSWTEGIKAPYPCGGFLSLSFDGKYLFFLNEGICWVSTSFIDKLKPKDLT